MSEEAKTVVDLIQKTVETAMESDKWETKGVFLLVRAEGEGGGWRFVMPGGMTSDELNDALDEAFKHPPLRISKKAAGTA